MQREWNTWHCTDFIKYWEETDAKFTKWITHDNAECCHIYKDVFGKKKNQLKVRDHDHYAGKYRGAAHLICNLRYSTQIDIPVFFHNGANFDFNWIINELAKEFRSEMRCIPLNTNKYMSFSIPIKKRNKRTKWTKRRNKTKRTKEKGNYL